jgi:hypothetical protein
MVSLADGRDQRRLFVATICAGSFLLFLVQPMIARMALPRLGGAPTVWNSAMVVYQALLLAGYAYAHWLSHCAPKVQRWTHLGLFALAGLTLPIGLLAQDLPPDANPVFWVPMLLLGSIGPLFFVVSAQAPLMQRWFTLTGGENPYPLYAASNLGSFAGLISFPLLVEPMMSVGQQRWLWTIGYLILFVLVALCSRAIPSGSVQHLTQDQGQTPRPDVKTMIKWIALAAIPSGFMLSTSLHLTTDIVAMPLLWVLPLGLYLLSFSVAFADDQRLSDLISRLAPLILLMAAAGTFADVSRYALVYAAVLLVALFSVSVALHGQMYASRPATRHLTLFYLMMSVGGMVGGIFCALVAPLVFNWAAEHPLLMIAAGFAMIRPPLFEPLERMWNERRWALPIAAVISILALIFSLSDNVEMAGLNDAVDDVAAAGLIIALAFVAIGKRWPFAATVAALMLTIGGWERIGQGLEPGRVTRSYFGIYTINEYDNVRSLVHGTTLHGLQNLKPGLERMPTTYYAPQSGVGLAMAAAPRLFGPNAHLAVVGLGTGTLACYAQPGQSVTIFEIDPVVVGIARDSGRFSYLSRCAPNADVLLGDARLVVAHQPVGTAQILAIDAFSSDAVPIHLLTQEAFDVYGRYLAKDGLLMVHVSNRYLDLRPVVLAAARKGWTARIRDYEPDAAGDKLHYTPSDWIALSRNPETIDRLVAASPKDGWKPLTSDGGPIAWTDEYASILPLIRWTNSR